MFKAVSKVYLLHEVIALGPIRGIDAGGGWGIVYSMVCRCRFVHIYGSDLIEV